MIPSCEGSLVINISKSGFVWNDNKPYNLKFIGIVVGGNVATNSNIGQFNFDYNKHVFNNDAEEFNRVSSKISRFNKQMEEELNLRIKGNQGNQTLQVVDNIVKLFNRYLI